MKILVRSTNWLGDAVICIPALREIRRAHPGDEIVLLARPWVADLYRREGFCDRILLYDAKGPHAGIKGRWRLASQLRAERFDLAILLQNAFDAALLAWMAGIPERIGYARDGRGVLLTRAVAVPKPKEPPVHQRYYYLELLRRAGYYDVLPVCDDILLAGRSEAVEAGRAIWKRRGVGARRWVGVSPGAAFGTAKRWLPERFAEAASTLAGQLDASVAVFGSAGEREMCQHVAELAGPRAHNLAGETTLGEYIDLAATCSLFLTNDSGAMHVAAALGIPTVTVFGATDHVATGPSARWARIVREPVECSPCHLRECPIDHRCMTRVEPARVVEEALRLLAEYPPSAPSAVV